MDGLRFAREYLCTRALRELAWADRAAHVEAADVFCIGMEPGLVKHELLEGGLFALFASWLLTDWHWDWERTGSPRQLGELLEGQRTVRHDERLLLGALRRSSISWHSVEDVERGGLVRLKDMLSGGREQFVYEGDCEVELSKGDVILARVVSLTGASVLFGMYPRIVPAEFRAEIFEDRDALEFEAGRGMRIRGLDREAASKAAIRAVFACLSERIHLDALPEEECGEIRERAEMRFETELTPAEVVRGLADLAFGSGLRRSAEMFALDVEEHPGRPITLGWEDKDNGACDITIEGRSVTLLLDKPELVETMKHRICRLLGDSIRYIETVQVSRPDPQRDALVLERCELEELEAECGDLDPVAGLPAGTELLEFDISGKAHWQAWLDEPNVDLEDASPRQAAASAEGRRLVVPLVRSLERDCLRSDPLRPDFAAMRRELGLD